MSSAALLVGVPAPAPSQIDGRTVPWQPLPGVANDLAHIRDMLRSAPDAIDETAILTLVRPHDTTPDNILAQLDRLTAPLAAGDTFVLYLSGHGFHVADDDGDEADGRDEVFIASDGTPMRDDLFAERWRRLPDGVTVIGLIDTCCAESNARALTHPATTLATPPTLAATTHTGGGASLLFLAASLEQQSAYETTVTGMPRGVLSAALTDVWQLTPRGRESLGFLFGFTQQLAAMYDARQTTNLTYIGRDYPLTMARAPFSVPQS